MIHYDEVQAAIAECEGVRRPNANTCLKLAALYTIRDNMQQEQERPKTQQTKHAGYSFATEQNKSHATDYSSESEFGHIVTGKDVESVLTVIDELLSTLQGMIPRLYAGVMGKLKDID
jgi:hypothetical protein